MNEPSYCLLKEDGLSEEGEKEHSELEKDQKKKGHVEEVNKKGIILNMSNKRILCSAFTCSWQKV